MPRAALLAVEGSASTNHGRVVDTFKAMVKRRRAKTGREHATALEIAFKLRMKADYGSEDLTQAGRELRDRMDPFLVYCQTLVEAAARGG
jgi:hypothetical protein